MDLNEKMRFKKTLRELVRIIFQEEETAMEIPMKET